MKSATGPGPRWAALAVLCTGEFVNVLGVTVVVVALPSIGDELDLSRAGLQWVASVYALLFGGLVMVCGRASDVYGSRRLFTAGLTAFAGASLLCGSAPTGAMLIAGRAAQGVAAAVTVPAALSLVTAVFPEGPDRDRAVGVWTAVAAGGGALGFFLGGVVTESLGWRWIFLLNVPVCAVAVPLARVLLEERRAVTPPRLDLAGATTGTAGLLLVIAALTRAEQAGFTGTLTLAGFAAAAALLSGFAVLEARVRDPLVPSRVMTLGTVSGPVVAAFTVTATTSGAAVLGTLHLQDVLGYSPTSTGLVYVPFSLAVIAGSSIGSWLVDRAGPGITIGAGLTTITAGMLSATAVSPHGGLPPLATALVLSGLGLGCASVAATATGVSAVPGHQRGMASGLLNTAAQLGTAVGIAALLAVARTSGAATAETLVAGYRAGFLTAAGLAFLGLLLSLHRLRSSPTRSPKGGRRRAQAPRERCGSPGEPRRCGSSGGCRRVA